MKIKAIIFNLSQFVCNLNCRIDSSPKPTSPKLLDVCVDLSLHAVNHKKETYMYR